MTTQNTNTPAVQGPPVNQALLKTKNFFKREEVMGKFESILGKDRAIGFVSSVLQVISSDKYLSNVEPQSIYQSAAMAAILNLPINNNLGYAWIVPYKGKAQMQIGWKGFVQLALRTREYKHINVLEVYANQFKSYDPITEELSADFTIEGEGAIAGYVAYFKLLNGFEKTVYWSTKRVTEHAKKYSKAFSHPTADTPWKDPVQFPEMAKKTVLKNTLSKWGILSIEMEKAAVSDQAVVKDVETFEIEYVDNPEHTDTVDTEKGEMKMAKENNAASSTENKITEKSPATNNKTEEPEASETSYETFKVRTIHNTYTVNQEEVEIGFVGVCTSDNGVTVAINNGEIVCPRSSVRLAAHDEALSSAENPTSTESNGGDAGQGKTQTEEPTALASPIRTDYSVEELTGMGTDLKIRHIANQYIDVEKLGLSRVTNRALKNIILHAQEGKLKWFVSTYYAGKESAIKSTYIETFVPPVVVNEEVPVANKEVKEEQPAAKTYNLVDVADGKERDFDQMREVFDYIADKTGDALNDDNLLPVVDKLGEGFFDVYTTIEKITQFASIEEINKIINKFLNK